MNKIAVVTGANRGLGFATGVALAKSGVHVIFCGRNEVGLHKALDSIKDEGLSFEAFVADVCDASQVSALAGYIEKEYGHLDILVNNAGVLIEASSPTDRDGASVFTVAIEKVIKTLEVNVAGALRMLQQMVPLLKKSKAGRIVNVSSGMGQHSDMGAGFPGYRTSKASLNVLTQLAALELEGTNIKINSVCPGWVQTDMGGSEATRSHAEGISGIIWAATLADDGPTGGFFRDGKALDW